MKDSQGSCLPVHVRVEWFLLQKKIRKANTTSCHTRQNQWQGAQTFFLPLGRSVLFISSWFSVYNICSFLFQMISDLMTGINSD